MPHYVAGFEPMITSLFEISRPSVIPLDSREKTASSLLFLVLSMAINRCVSAKRVANVLCILQNNVVPLGLLTITFIFK